MNSLCSQYKTKRETKWKMKRSEKTKQSEKWSDRFFSPASFGQNEAQNETNGTKEPASGICNYSIKWKQEGNSLGDLRR